MNPKVKAVRLIGRHGCGAGAPGGRMMQNGLEKRLAKYPKAALARTLASVFNASVYTERGLFETLDAATTVHQMTMVNARIGRLVAEIERLQGRTDRKSRREINRKARDLGKQLRLLDRLKKAARDYQDGNYHG